MKVHLLLLPLAFGLVTGCATVRTPVVGALYTDAASSESVSSNHMGKKRGESCAQSILGLVATGDASTEAAAKAGGITKISHVDSKSNNIIGVIAKYCTVVYGE